VPDDDTSGTQTMHRLVANVPRAMYAELRRHAQNEDSLASLVRRIFREWLRAHRDPVQ